MGHLTAILGSSYSQDLRSWTTSTLYDLDLDDKKFVPAGSCDLVVAREVIHLPTIVSNGN